MGGASGKRSRAVAGRPKRSVDPGSVTHGQSFADVVRESRDPEFAAERRDAKRRRVGSGKGRSGRSGDIKNADGDVEEDANATQEAPARLSKKILGEALKQREEVREEELEGIARSAAGKAKEMHIRRKLGNERGGVAAGGDSEDSDSEDSAAGEAHDRAEDDNELEEDEHIVGAEVLDGSALTAADELALAMFAGEGGDGDGGAVGEGALLFGSAPTEGDDNDGGEGEGGRVMLADVILAKIREKAEADAAAAEAAADPEAAARNQKIAEVYNLVGNIMSRYKSGRVPKAFKVIPKLPNWEDLMYLTRPDGWTPAAMFAATRLFASNLSAKQVVPFYRDVLLPSVLQDISENKKLNYHLYRALKKAIYKPDAFNKGILFPLCEPGGCSLREATIIGSVLTRVSIPMLHSAAALLFIAEQPYNVSNSVFIHTLLNKKYSLPYRVVDALVVHFTRMKRDSARLPLVWHISLLTFARRYRTEMEAGQKEELKLLMRVHTHDKVTPEIRRELFSAKSRGEVMDPDPNTIARAIASAC